MKNLIIIPLSLSFFSVDGQEKRFYLEPANFEIEKIEDEYPTKSVNSHFGLWLDENGFITPGPKIKNWIDRDKDNIDDRFQAGPGEPAGKRRPDDFKPKPELPTKIAPFPEHWGKPPDRQTRDLVQLLGDFGKGSSTLAKWIEFNLHQDSINDYNKGTTLSYWQNSDLAQLPGSLGNRGFVLAKWIESNLYQDKGVLADRYDINGSNSSANRGDFNFINGPASGGNTGFILVSGWFLGVGYDRADNNSTNQFDGHESSIHLDLVNNFGQFFAGISSEYRQAKYTLTDVERGRRWETKYYGPRVDLGWVFTTTTNSKNLVPASYAWIQLTGAYLWGNAKLDDESGSNGYVIQSGLMVGVSKQLTRHLALEPEANIQWAWQKLGVVDYVSYKNRNYGRSDFNLGLQALLTRDVFISPNIGYRWDMKAVCTQADRTSSSEQCVPKASGIRYGVQVGKNIGLGHSFFNQLALSAYYDYFKKSGVKQTQWGMMAQYLF